MTHVTVYDRDSRPYRMTLAEAQIAVKSGAYTTDKPLPAEVPSKSHGISQQVAVIEKASGKLYHMLAVDAREAVKSKYFVYEADTKTTSAKQEESLAEVVEVEVPEIREETANTAQESAEGTQYPVLTEKNSKAQITATLEQYDITYRSNMNITQLLSLWQEYLAEQPA